MGITRDHGVALSASALLLLGLTGCSGTAAPTDAPAPVQPPAAQETSDVPEAPSAPSLADAQGDIAWPAAMTFPIPQGMNFDYISSEYACDGTLLAVLVSSPDATEEQTTAYLEGMQDAFGTPADTRAGTGQDSLWNRDGSGALKADGTLTDRTEPLGDPTKIIGWKQLEAGGYRFHLQETPTPGIPVQVANTAPAGWNDFPRPEPSAFERCQQRDDSGYRADAGFTPVSTTWTLTGPMSVQPEVVTWMESLAAEGWELVAQGESGPKVGAPDAILQSDSHTAQYIIVDGTLTLFVGDRKLDEFLGL